MAWSQETVRQAAIKAVSTYHAAWASNPRKDNHASLLTPLYNRVINTLTSSFMANKLEVNRHGQFLAQLNRLKEISECADAKIMTTEAGSILVEINGINFELFTDEEVYILHEIFVLGVYNVILPSRVVVFDIGMNVGIASLFFAKNNQVDEVQGFEPFPETYQRAVKNFERNPRYRNMIIVHNVGLAIRSSNPEVTYSTTWCGSNTMYGLRHHLRKIKPPFRRTRITLIKAADIVGKYVAEHPTKSIIIKMDCEGAEYEIFESLRDAQLLRSINGFMIEWQYESPATIERTLVDAGFTTWSFTPLGPWGMIYALRT